MYSVVCLVNTVTDYVFWSAVLNLLSFIVVLIAVDNHRMSQPFVYPVLPALDEPAFKPQPELDFTHSLTVCDDPAPLIHLEYNPPSVEHTTEFYWLNRQLDELEQLIKAGTFIRAAHKIESELIRKLYHTSIYEPDDYAELRSRFCVLETMLNEWTEQLGATRR